MGVNAQMLVKTKAKVTDEILRDWSWNMVGCLGRDSFWFFEATDIPLKIVTEFHQDGDSIQTKEGETLIDVNIGSRYYGPDYERGDFSKIYFIAEWLERNIPDCEIWYGGDSSGICAELFDSKAREKMKEYCLTKGRLPYCGAFSHRGNPPQCPRCQKPMLESGGGGADTFYYCYGCPTHAIGNPNYPTHFWHDGKDTLQVVNELRLKRQPPPNERI